MNKPLTKNLSKTAVFAVAIAACLAFAGCAGSSAQGSSASSAGSTSASAASASASASASSASSQASEGVVFGDQTATAQKFVVKNETGATIATLVALPASGEGQPVAIMKSGEWLPAGEQATLYIDSAVGNPINMSFLVGTEERQLHNVDMARLGEASIKLEGDVAYLTAQVDGNPVSTLQEEMDLAHPPAAAAEEQQQYYEEPVYYDEGGGGAAPAQTEDSCVSDVILN